MYCVSLIPIPVILVVRCVGIQALFLRTPIKILDLLTSLELPSSIIELGMYKNIYMHVRMYAYVLHFKFL